MTDEERVTFAGPALPSEALWTPKVGRAVRGLGRTLRDEGEIDAAAFDHITQEAVRVVAQAAPPDGATARRTGLVVGYVQSGKTMSMTTVAALARDNGFRMVIVFAGVTKILLSQTKVRFQSHLQPPGQYPEQWRMLDSEQPAHLKKSTHELQNLVACWSNTAIPEDRKPALMITVMKNYRHLAALAKLLRSVDLKGVPVLIIDDEADQAGLNTKPTEPRASSTHRHIAVVRSLLPHHTYLQYTATPQAPLLISLIDMLSPEFAEILDAGAGYTGGEAFFDRSRRLAQPLGASDLFKPGDPPSDPPDGLVEALQQFFVAAAAFAVQSERGERNAKGPWSMLIHPSHRQSDHQLYFRWVQRLQAEWRRELELPDSDLDRVALVDEFRVAYDELARTANSLPPFADVATEIRYLVGQAVITELNSESGDEVRWNNGFAHILVGGEKLNRGFTVKGLAITYMPRGPGGWNADTIQQRARFFGYKARYLDRCRVHLHPQVLQAYRDYVEHESHVRQKLEEYRGRPLTEWKRAFFMDGALRPTRANVLSDPYYRVRQQQNWFLQHSPHEDAIRKGNALLVEGFISGLSFQPHWDDGRHLAAVVSLADLQGHLLVPAAVIGHHDVRWMYAVRVWLDTLLQRAPTAEAQVLIMDGGRADASARTRERTAESGLLKLLPQGRDQTGRGTYPGDREMYDPERVTVQIHRLRVREGSAEYEGVYALAVRIPSALSAVIVQPGAA